MIAGLQSQMLTIFLKSGRTFTFRNVTVDTDNETVLVFRYVAMSDGAPKTATFYKGNVAGVGVQD